MEANNTVPVSEIMMKDPVTLNADDILDLANDIMHWAAFATLAQTVKPHPAIPRVMQG